MSILNNKNNYEDGSLLKKEKESPEYSFLFERFRSSQESKIAPTRKL